MTIHAYFPSTNAFDPKATLAMSTAFELACVGTIQVFCADERGREIIATRIIHLAHQGLIDAAALHQCVVAEARLSA